MAKKAGKSAHNGMAAVQLEAVRAAAVALAAREARETEAKKDLKAARSDVHKCLKALRKLAMNHNPLFEQGKDGPE